MSRIFAIITTITLIFIALAVFGGLTWANTLYVSDRPVEKEFLVPWLAARTFLQYGDSPYSEPATQRAQVVYYGRLAFEGEDSLRVYTMLPVEMLYFPFALITDYSIALGLWMTLGEISLAAVAFLCLSLTGWKPHRFLLSVVLLFSIFWFYAFTSLVIGSPAPFVALGLFGALAAIRADKDELAGALLSLSLLEVGISVIFLLFILWWTVTFHRWRVWGGFLMVVGFFTIASFLLLPSWFLPFLRGVISHSHYNPGITVAALLNGLWPALGPKLSLVITAVLGAFLFIEWRLMRGKDFRHILWVAGLTLSAMPLLGLPFSLDAHLLLILPLILLLSVAYERWTGGRATLVGGVILAGLFLLLWLASGSIRTIFLALPLLLLVGLYWMRWWAVHPPRTWRDNLP